MDTGILQEVEIGALSVILAHSRLGCVKNILQPDFFPTPILRKLYETMLEKPSLDMRTLHPVVMGMEEFPLGERKDLIATLFSTLTIHAQLPHYVESLRAEHMRRQVTGIMASDLQPAEKAQQIAEIWKDHAAPETKEAIPITNALYKSMETTAEAYKAGGKLLGVPTGINALDGHLCGLERASLYVMAGRPAMGKSSLALTIGSNIAREHSVLFFSLEMSATQLAQRVFARHAGVKIWNQKTGRNVNFFHMQDTIDFLSGSKLFLFEDGGVTAEWIISKCRQHAKKHPPRLIIVDHLGIVAARDNRLSRVYQIGEMTAVFKALAKELDCSVLLLHQLNRAVEGRENKRPTLADLRDSGSVEQDADAVMLLFREEYYLRQDEGAKDRNKWEDSLQKCANKAEIIIAKNRQGESGIVTCRFDADRQVFEDIILQS